MPYIKQEDREKFVDGDLGSKVSLMQLIGERCNNAGELNYAFTVIAQTYLKEKGLRYQNINDIVGALEGAKMEMYRRIAAPYEDTKIAENGDVNALDIPIEDVVQLGEA